MRLLADFFKHCLELFPGLLLLFDETRNLLRLKATRNLLRLKARFEVKFVLFFGQKETYATVLRIHEQATRPGINLANLPHDTLLN